jgi:hypothetical protein
MLKLKGSKRLQFPFEFASLSFSDGPGLKDIIFFSLRHQMVQILYELLSENRKKVILIFNVLLALHIGFKVIFEKTTCHLLWLSLENVQFRAVQTFISPSSIIWIVKRRFWRMKAVTRSTFVLVLRGTGRPNRSPYSTVSRPHASICATEVLEGVVENRYQMLSESLHMYW